MGKLILVFQQDGYPEEGGGLYIEYPKDLKSMDIRCNELLKNGNSGEFCVIILAGELETEYEYHPIEKVTVFERKEV